MDNFDIAVIGGGIHGVGVAQAAAAAGYSVVVLEKTAIAAGTSSRSSKLIHGGLRYLESGQLKLVYTALCERDRLCRLAPELVKLQQFYIPVYRTTRRRPWQIWFGLFIYALLGGLSHAARFRHVARSGWSSLAGLQQKNLQQVFQYWDAQTDDRLLTQAVLQSAQQLGAQLVCPAQVMKINMQQQGFLLEYQQGESLQQVNARVVINAAGPWVNQILTLVEPKANLLAVDLVQGTHLILDVSAPNGIYYLEAVDQRAVFVMPWQGKTMVGTTETLFTGNPDDVTPLDSEVEYLLNVYQHYFPDVEPVRVIEKFAGLRVLPAANRTMFSRPRDTVLHWTLPGLLTLYGGKLTAYRATAEAVVNKLKPLLTARQPVADTAQLSLSVR